VPRLVAVDAVAVRGRPASILRQSARSLRALGASFFENNPMQSRIFVPTSCLVVRQYRASKAQILL
jgi:hypothetical protein